MARAKQSRAIRTREKILNLAREQASTHGYGVLRIEELVSAAAVAKGTFFAHFKDKDALMDILIAEKINGLLDELEEIPKFRSVEHIVESLMPYLLFISSERYIFDVFLRLSGALAVEEIGEIAMSLCRLDQILIEKLGCKEFRQDVPLQLLSEGIQAFGVSSIAYSFCTPDSDQELSSKLTVQLRAWLCPGMVAN